MARASGKFSGVDGGWGLPDLAVARPMAERDVVPVQPLELRPVDRRPAHGLLLILVDEQSVRDDHGEAIPGARRHPMQRSKPRRVIHDGSTPDDDAAVEQADELTAVITDDGGRVAPRGKVVQLVR